MGAQHAMSNGWLAFSCLLLGARISHTFQKPLRFWVAHREPCMGCQSSTIPNLEQTQFAILRVGPGNSRTFLEVAQSLSPTVSVVWIYDFGGNTYMS
jgi:hypothetical protein